MNQALTTGQKIKFFRQRANLSQFELELLIGAAPGSISRAENNKINSTKETLFQIANALNLNTDEQASLIGISIDNKFLLAKSLINFYRNTVCTDHIDAEKIYRTLNEISVKNIEFFQGKELISEICCRTLDYSQKEMFFISNNMNWRNVFQEEYSKEYYIPIRMQRGIFMRTIFTKDECSIKESKENKLFFRDSRFISNSLNVVHSIGLTEKNTFIFECKEPYKIFVIHNEDFTNAIKDLFMYFWDASEDPKF